MKRKVYFNDAQLEFRYTAAHTSVVVAGRRTGKSHGMHGPWLQRNLQYMPGSSGAIVGAAYQRLLTQTLPGTLNYFKSAGFIRDVHYFIGRKPDPKLNFLKPAIDPVSYDHVISWYNGSIQYLISQDIKGTSNSLTLQYIAADEAKFIKHEQFKDETLPANGGYKGPWRNSPWLNSILITSDMPTSKAGSWFLNYREKMDPDLIATIQALVIEIFNIKQELKENPESDWLKRKLRENQLHLAKLRSVAVYYKEWSSIENLQVLGEKYIATQKRDLPPLVFQTSIMCMRPGKLKGGFYPGLRGFHFYTAYNNSYLQDLNYNLDKATEQSCLQDGDIDLNRPLCVSFDYNANINWLVVGQPDGLKARVVKSFYVKYQRKLRELVDDFCEYYRHHSSREVVFYYDTTALGSNYAVSDEDFATVIADQFQKKGWTVHKKFLGQPMKHSEKYLILDQAFKGQKYLLPQINELNNEALKIGLEFCDVRVGPLGFQKDKTGEKLAESEEDRLEHRTDGTDAFDNLLLGMFFHPFNTIMSSVGSASTMI